MAELLAVVEQWRDRRRREGARVTVLDLYALVAQQRGVAPTELTRDERYALATSVQGDIWPGYATTEGSYRGSDVLTVVEHDPAWAGRYAGWAEKIRQVLAGTVRRLEHVGSTAVPGLPAKPIIDIQVSVEDLVDESRYVGQLASIGLQLRSRDDYHRYFRPFPDQPRTVHVHVCAQGSVWEREHVAFRDHLRTHAADRAAYAAAKRAAVVAWADDGLAYTDAKTEVVLDILGRLDEAAGGSAPDTSD